MELVLDRTLYDDASVGALAGEALKLTTLELPWVPDLLAPCGVKGRSCVPVGAYALVPHHSEKHPQSWALVNHDLWVYHQDEEVPADRKGLARTECLLHIANYVRQLEGCIAVGLYMAEDARHVRMLQNSTMGMSRLRAALVWPTAHSIVIQQQG